MLTNVQVKAAIEQMHGFSMRFKASGRGDGQPDPDVMKRESIVKTLRSGGTGAVQALAAELNSPDVAIRKNASFVLGELAGLYGGPKMDIGAAVPALTQAISDKDFEVSVWSMAALGSMGKAAKSAIPALKLALKDKNPGIRTNAQYRLAQIEGKPEPKTGEAGVWP